MEPRRPVVRIKLEFERHEDHRTPKQEARRAVHRGQKRRFVDVPVPR